MKESAWRTQLVQMWRKRTEPGFIWVHDAKFKAGFPDLYTIVNGDACHYELKVHNQLSNYWQNILDAFEPIQVVTLGQIAIAGGRARGLILRNDKSVVLVDFNARKHRIYQDYEFAEAWMTDRFLS